MIAISIIPSIVALLAPKMSISSKVNVRIVSDVVWPFCYVGLRHLQAASQQSGVGINLEVLPFLLNPTMSDDGVDVVEHLTKLYGPGIERQLKDPNSGINTMGRNVGIKFNYDRTYNTKKVHALVEYVKSKDSETANQLVERLFASYFEQNFNLSDTEQLVKMAEDVGCEEGEARSAMASNKQAELLKKARIVKSQWGVSGVPLFIIEQNNGKDPVTFSGAKPVDFISTQLEKASSSD